MTHITAHTTAPSTSLHHGAASGARRLLALPVALALVAIPGTGSARAGDSTSVSPLALTWVVDASDRPSLTPGGSVFDSQVPPAAWAAALAVAGSSLYDSQVPAAAR